MKFNYFEQVLENNIDSYLERIFPKNIDYTRYIYEMFILQEKTNLMDDDLEILFNRLFDYSEQEYFANFIYIENIHDEIINNKNLVIELIKELNYFTTKRYEIWNADKLETVENTRRDLLTYNNLYKMVIDINNKDIILINNVIDLYYDYLCRNK